MRRSLTLMLLLLTSSAASAQNPLPPCTNDKIAAAISRLPAAIVLQPQGAVEQLSQAYGCTFNQPHDLKVVAADNTMVGKLEGILAGPQTTSRVDGGNQDPDYLKVSDYVLIKKLSDSKIYAIDGNNWKLDFSEDGKAAKFIVSKDVKSSLYNPKNVNFTDAVFGPPTVDLETFTATNIAWLSTVGTVPGRQRKYVTFRSKPAGAQVWKGTSSLTMTEAVIDLDSATEIEYKITMDGYKECPYSSAIVTPGAGPSAETFFCELVPNK